MATIITKNSSTASSVPSAGSLVKGELAVNVTDKKLYTKDNGGSVVVVGQEPLISGTNIKTINGTSVLGSGDITIGAGTVKKLSDVADIDDLGTVTFPSSISAANASRRLIRLSSTLDVLIYTNTTTSDTIQLVAYNPSTNAIGTPVLVRSTARMLGAVAASATSLLIASCNATTGFEAVVVSFSGTTATVNTAATATLGGNFANASSVSLARIGASNSFAVLYNRATSVIGVRGLSVSGTTVTIGAEATLTGASTTSGSIVSLSDTTFVTTHSVTTTTYATPFTVSGATVTKGTEATVTGSNVSVFGVSSNTVLTSAGTITVAANVATYTSASYGPGSYFKKSGSYFIGNSNVVYDNAGSFSTLTYPASVSLYGFIGNTAYATRLGRLGSLSFSGSTITFTDLAAATTNQNPYSGTPVTWLDGAAQYASTAPIEGATTVFGTQSTGDLTAWFDNTGTNGVTVTLLTPSFTTSDPTINATATTSGTSIRIATIKALA